MLIAWLLFPLLLVLLAAGVGLLAEALSGRRVPGVLLIALGLAGLIVAGQVSASFDATAELTVPLAGGLAAAGFAVALARGRDLRPDPAPLTAFLVVGLAAGAPVIASGDPTFAGYIRLDDTATWLALTDRIMEHGRSLEGLAPSSYEATLDFNLADGYPIGVFVPLGLGAELTATDPARLIQPYMSVLAGALALGLYALGARFVEGRWARALVAAVAAQAALLVGYVQWGGVKEAAAAALIALGVALAVRLARSRTRMAAGRRLRAALPAALASAALLAVLSAGGALWLLPPLALGLALGMRRAGAREAIARAASLAGLAAVLTLPAIVTGALLPPTSSPLTSDTAQGNLIEPLGVVRLAGIWPAGDFRREPVDELAAGALVALAFAAAAVGLAIALWRRRRLASIYGAGVLAACGAILLLGSPWVDAKAMATASPVVLFLGLGAALTIASARGAAHRVAGGAAVLILVAGVVWSNALAYREVNLAPFDQLAELEEIGSLVAGAGPALMTEYQPYGVRHYLRDADPEGVSELRRRTIPLRNGDTVEKGVNADTDELGRSALFTYPTLVLRRSPVQSRPPAPYRLVWRGEHYEVWQRPAGAERAVRFRLGMGSALDPTAEVDCRELRELAGFVPDGTLTAARREGTVVVPLGGADHPPAWIEGRRSVRPVGGGRLDVPVTLPRGGPWRIWLAGSVRGEVEVAIDGAPVGSARHFLNNYGFHVALGEADLEAGRHEVELRFSQPALAPGAGGFPEAAGPLIFAASEPDDAELVRLPAARADRLCGHRWDWIEIG